MNYQSTRGKSGESLSAAQIIKQGLALDGGLFIPDEIPTLTEEEIKAFKKAQKEQEKLQKAALKNQPKTRSLHYIDEDDYDELPEVKPQKDTTVADKLNGSDRPEIKD